MLKTGQTFSKEYIVEKTMTAEFVGSGGLPVLATPKLVAIVESIAFRLAEIELEEDFTTVGTNINLNHISPTLDGKKFKVHVTLTRMENRKLLFGFKAYDEGGEIANGEHTRFIVNVDKFMTKANSK